MLNPTVYAPEVWDTKTSKRRVRLLSGYCRFMIVVVQDCLDNTVR